ncbi:MAG: hypothetical protein ACO1OB_06360 [Archangium sp.]
MRALALVCFVAFAARAELPEKSKWSWSVVSGGGHSTRFMLVIEARPSARKAREWWTVQTGARDANGRTPLTLTVRNSAGTKKSAFTVWEENGETRYGDGARVVTRVTPPRVLSMERVPCESPLLGDFRATCSGRAGGPLQQPELPLMVVVQSRGDRTGDTIATLAIGLITGGILIPGGEDHSIVARMDALPPPKLEKSLEAWRRSAHTRAALETLALADDAETLGAALVLAKTPSVDVATDLIRRGPSLDRWPLLRLLRQTTEDDGLTLRVISRLVDSQALLVATTTDERTLQSSALVGLHSALTGAVEGLLAGSMPHVQAAASGHESLDVAALRSLQKDTLVPGESVALVQLLSPAVRQKSYASFLERLPDEEALAVIRSLGEGASPDTRLRTLERVPDWVDHMLRAGRGNDVLQTLVFDAERVTLLDGVRSRSKPEERIDLLFMGMRAMAFDGGRLSLLRNWKPKLLLNREQRLEVLKAFTHDPELSTAARLLLDGVEEPERRELVFAWLERTTNDHQRILGVQEHLTRLEVSEAQRLIRGMGFDDAKQKATPVLMALVPQASRADFFVDCVAAMSFDGGRLSVLQSPEAPTLNAAQKARALKAFVFDRAKAEALLK